MAIDRFVSRLNTFGFAAAEQSQELPQGVNIHAIRGRLTCTVTVAGGAADGALITEGIQRLLARVRVNHDGVDFVQPVDGRQLSQIHARSVAAMVAPVNLAIPGVQAATPVAFDFTIPFSHDYLVAPIDTCLPGTLPVKQNLTLFFAFNQATNAGAGSGLGSGAFVFGGDRAVTLGAVALTFEAVYSVTRVAPWAIGGIRTLTTVQIAAANNLLPLSVRGFDPFDGVLFRYLQNVDQDVQEGFNFVDFQAGSGAVSYWRNRTGIMMQREDLGLFPAAAAAGQVGTIFARIADNGRLSSAVVPREMPDPNFVFDVAAPGVAPGFVQGTFLTLIKRPGITRDRL
jgi:hypothetical protein